jgi:membrane protease YdiL (CAAX protease family)
VLLQRSSYQESAKKWREQTSGRRRIHNKEANDSMIDAEQALSPSIFRRVFYGPSEIRAGWRLCIFLAIVTTLIEASNLIVRQMLHGADDTTLFLVREVMDFFIFLLASWIMGRIEGRTIADYGLPWRGMFRLQFWQGALLGFVAITGLLVAMRLAGVFYFGSIALHGADIWKWAIVYAFVFILVALREEFRARGYGLFTLSAGMGFWPAAIVSAAFFGYSHHGNSGEDFIGLFNAGAFGLLACFLLRRTGNLWMPIGLHMAFDWGETYFYGVADSGQTLPGHLLNSSSFGPAWLSGGTVGPEGSLLCTLLIIVVWLICAGWLRGVRYPKPAQVLNSSDRI